MCFNVMGLGFNPMPLGSSIEGKQNWLLLTYMQVFHLGQTRPAGSEGLELLKLWCPLLLLYVEGSYVKLFSYKCFSKR